MTAPKNPMIYADNAATTSVHARVLEAMLPYFSGCYANPSAQHAPGRAAADALAAARDDVARCLGCSPREVVFCASGSEANNQALRSAAAWGRSRGRMHIVSSAFEHPSVLRTLGALRDEGFDVTLVSPDRDGIVSPASIEEVLVPGHTCLVSVMTVNNEVGTVQPIDMLAAAAHGIGALFHTDAVQAAGHMPVDARAMGLDMLTLSAHKFHGPKGAGALICREVGAVSIIHGGGQERGRRAGTENVPGIVGLACALREACEQLEYNARHTAELRDRLIDGLTSIQGAHLIGGRSNRCPGIVNVCFEGVNREALVIALDAAGICASAGSACSAGAVAVSHVLRAMGVPGEIAAGSLRLSLSADNTAAEVGRIIAETRGAVERLRSLPSY